MRRILIAGVLGLSGLSLVAQNKQSADDAKVMTITGCLGGGAPSFVLTNAAAAAPAGKPEGRAGTAAVASAYALVPSGGVALAPHLGNRVELVGTVLEPEKAGEPSGPAARAKRGPTARFSVTSVKMISPVCIE